MYSTVLQYLEKTALKYPDKTAFADIKESFTFYNLLLFSKKSAVLLQVSSSRITPSLFIWINGPTTYFLLWGPPMQDVSMFLLTARCPLRELI